MGSRFHKSINLGGGMKLNIGKGSVGFSVGTKGARISVNSRGKATTSVGIPGSGLSYVSTTQIGQKKHGEASALPDAAPAVNQEKAPACVWCGRKRKLLESFNKYGFCMSCKQEVRTDIESKKQDISLFISQFENQEIRMSEARILEAVEEHLATLDELEELRSRVPMFKSSLDDIRAKLQEIKAVLAARIENKP